MAAPCASRRGGSSQGARARPSQSAVGAAGCATIVAESTNQGRSDPGAPRGLGTMPGKPPIRQAAVAPPPAPPWASPADEATIARTADALRAKGYGVHVV